MLLFLRDAMRKRGLCCRLLSVCLSVCHVHVLYADGRRYRQTSFSGLLAPSFNFFLLQTPIPNSKGTHQRVIMYTKGVTRLRISTEITCLGNGKDSCYVTLIGSQKWRYGMV